MNEKQTYVLIAFLILFLILSFLAGIRILKSNYIERNQKIMNILMLFLLPILWSLFILIFFSKPKKTKNDGYEYRDAGYSNYTKYGG